MLTWSPPKDDGGTGIVRYIVEKRETSRSVWTKLTGSVKPDAMKYEVKKLTEGKEYEFQVNKGIKK